MEKNNKNSQQWGIRRQQLLLYRCGWAYGDKWSSEKDFWPKTPVNISVCQREVNTTPVSFAAPLGLGNIMQAFLPGFVFKVKPFDCLGIQLLKFIHTVHHISFTGSFSLLHHTLLFLQAEFSACLTYLSSKVIKTSPFGDKTLIQTWSGML